MALPPRWVVVAARNVALAHAQSPEVLAAGGPQAADAERLPIELLRQHLVDQGATPSDAAVAMLRAQVGRDLAQLAAGATLLPVAKWHRPTKAPADRRVVISVRLDRVTCFRLDAEATRTGLDRSAVVERLVAALGEPAPSGGLPPAQAVDAADIEAAVAAWNATPVGHHGHLISNRFEHDQLRAALQAVLARRRA